MPAKGGWMKRPLSGEYSPIILLQILCICGSVYALQNSTAEDGSNAVAVHQLGITGKGVNVGLISARNVRDTHEAFKDKPPKNPNTVHIFNTDYSGSDVNYAGGMVPGHDTWVAGIIASRGWTGRLKDIGTAPGCDIYSARVVDNAGNIDTDYVQAALQNLIDNNDCRVIMTGFQFNPNSVSDQWTLIYDYFAEEYDVVFANAAGNDLAYISVFGDAYNGITTAALIDEPNDFYLRVGTLSNSGPTLDGRRKPEISCPGSSQTTPSIGSDTSYYTTAKDGATSFAVPHTAGVVALLLEYANSTIDADDGHSEVVKAVIVNSTFPNIKDKSGNPTNPTAWHAQRGYGRIDALRAYETLSAGRINKGTTTTSMLGWAYDTMGSTATHYYYIAGKKNERLILTVTWNRAVTREWISRGKYWRYDDEPDKFNIDLKVAPSSSPEPNLFSETDPNNNLEKVDILLPADGNYTITLANSKNKSRDYGLAFERLPAMAGDFNIDYAVDGNDLSQIISDWLDTGKDTNIAPDPDGRTNWLDFAEFADNWLKIDRRYYAGP